MHKVLLAIFPVTLFFWGCGGAVEPSPAPESFKPEFIQLFLSRAELASAEFEQFKLSPGGIFVECGNFSRGKTIPNSQDFKQVSSDLLEKIRAASWDTVEFTKRSGSDLPEPGVSDSLFDPGQALFVVQSQGKPIEIKTSVNALASANGILETKLRRLARLVREAGQSGSCGKGDFYGIGSNEES